MHSFNPTDPSPPRCVTITRVFQDGVELNWLPPTEPNGEVHYAVEYKREDSGNWTSVNTTSDSTHYNLTGLHSGTNYTIRVVAVNSAGRAPITPTPTSSTAEPTTSTAEPTTSTAEPSATVNSTREDDKGQESEQRMATHIVNEAVISFKLAQMNTSYLECQTSASHATHFILVSFTAGALNLPAVLAGAVVAFLLLILLIAGIIVGAVLLGRVNRKGKSIGKSEGLVERIEGANKQAQSLENASTSGNDGEQQIVEAAFHYEHADMHYESTDVTGQRCGKEKDNGIWSDGGHYDYALTGQRCGREKDNGMWSDGGHYDYAERDVLKEGAGHRKKTSTVQEYQPKGIPNAVYAVVDMSKKKKHKTQKGASAATAQGVDTEEQHYECSSGLGQDWLGNVNLERNHSDVGQGSLSNDANETGPQTGPHKSGAVYAVVDKSKKGNKEMKNSDQV